MSVKRGLTVPFSMYNTDFLVELAQQRDSMNASVPFFWCVLAKRESWSQAFLVEIMEVTGDKNGDVTENVNSNPAIRRPA